MRSAAVRRSLASGRAHRVAVALVLAGLAGAAPSGARAAPEDGGVSQEAVVLLHGLGRSRRSMSDLGAFLAKRGGLYVVNLDYDSTSESPDALVAQLTREIARCCSAAPKLHFVTHSLGGILVRAILARERPENLGRVVMLAPPNQGSEIVDSSETLRWVLGPTGGVLGTGEESLPNRLPPPDYEVGIVAGTASINPVGSAILPDEDDGAVALERTKLEGMTDFIAVPFNHTFIMQEPKVAELVLRFLRYGRFADPLAKGDGAEELGGVGR